MPDRTTVASSSIASGLVTLLLIFLPGKSLWWGISFLVLGTIILLGKKS